MQRDNAVQNTGAQTQPAAAPPKPKPAGGGSPLAQLRRSTAAMDGVTRAAVLMFILGEKAGAEVLKHLDQKEVTKVTAAMKGKNGVTVEEVEKTIDRLNDDMSRHTNLAVDADGLVRSLAVSALGDTKAASMLDGLSGRANRGIDQLKWMDPRNVYEMLKEEHPQIIALTLAHLEEDHAAKVLVCFVPRVRKEVVQRIASLEGIQPQAMAEFDDVLEKTLSGNAGKLRTAKVGGYKHAANIMNNLDGKDEQVLMSDLRADDAQMAGRLEELMFTFDDLANVNDLDVQKLLREVDKTKLTIALKGADEKITSVIYRNMSSRAADALRDDIKVGKAVRISEVNAAQKEILAVARKLAEAGTISLSNSSDEMVQ